MEQGTPSYDVCVIGLGYVGLTLATALADCGLCVLGVERRPDVVKLLREGKPHFEEVGLPAVLSRVVREGKLHAVDAMPPSVDCPAFVITVGTPLDADGNANLEMIADAAEKVAAVMPEQALVILRSTVMIGTARDVVAPVLESSGRPFHLAMCPERTLQGKALQELRSLPQIVGADSSQAREAAARLFAKLTPTVLQVSSLEAAETIKLVDNTYRDLCFGFANEIARLCDAIGVDVHEVVGQGKLGYERTDVALPGLVGGPCLEKDPHILLQSAQRRGLDLEMTRAARKVNERQPDETIAFVAETARKRGLGSAPRIALLGMAFKGHPATDDLRGAMSLKVLAAIGREFPQAHVTVHDPLVPQDRMQALDGVDEVAPDIESALRDAQVIVFANNHRSFTELGYETIEALAAPEAIVYDYWNHFPDVVDRDFLARYYLLGNAGGAR